MRHPFRFLTCALPLALTLAGCTTAGGTDAPATATASTLAGTDWTLVKFQSMDDAQGTTAPPPERTYTLSFGTDGALSMQLDCNRGRAQWESVPSGKEGGSLNIGPVAATRALCPQPDVGEKMARFLPDVASYTLRDGHLFLALKMDGGIFEFAPR